MKIKNGSLPDLTSVPAHGAIRDYDRRVWRRYVDTRIGRMYNRNKFHSRRYALDVQARGDVELSSGAGISVHKI